MSYRGRKEGNYGNQRHSRTGFSGRFGNGRSKFKNANTQPKQEGVVPLKCHVCGKPVSEITLTERFNKHPNKEIAFCSEECKKAADKKNMEAMKETLKQRKT